MMCKSDNILIIPRDVAKLTRQTEHKGEDSIAFLSFFFWELSFFRIWHKTSDCAGCYTLGLYSLITAGSEHEAEYKS